jgi:hypothetical protein
VINKIKVNQRLLDGAVTVTLDDRHLHLNPALHLSSVSTKHVHIKAKEDKVCANLGRHFLRMTPDQTLLSNRVHEGGSVFPHMSHTDFFVRPTPVKYRSFGTEPPPSTGHQRERQPRKQFTKSQRMRHLQAVNQSQNPCPWFSSSN